ncbi:MAG: hypothetical protein ABI415_04090 [Flavitalea sp.]
MEQLFPDKRKAITGEFFINDSRIKHSCRKAYKKIRSYKDSLNTHHPDSEVNYHLQFSNLVRHSFFNTVSNQYILSKEKYNEKPRNN